jgi:hypothetical protein
MLHACAFKEGSGDVHVAVGIRTPLVHRELTVKNVAVLGISAALVRKFLAHQMLR